MAIYLVSLLSIVYLAWLYINTPDKQGKTGLFLIALLAIVVLNFMYLQ